MESREVSELDLPQRHTQRAYQDESTVMDVPTLRSVLVEQFEEKTEAELVEIWERVVVP